MNNQNQSVLSHLDLQALLASMPQEFRNAANLETMAPKQEIIALPQPTIFNNELNHFLLQHLHNQAAASAVAAAAIASTMASSPNVGVNTEIFSNSSPTASVASLATPHTPGFLYSNLNAYTFNGMPFGIPALPPHNSFGFLSNMNQLRSSVSAMPSPVSSTNQITPDIRPRAFSSAATLQNTRECPMERRRKRSYRIELPAKPIAIRPIKGESVLRDLVETEDEPSEIRLPMPTSHDEYKLRMDMAKVFNQAAEKNKKCVLGSDIRKIINDEDLPDTVGPDSPFRHHPKYQKKLGQTGTEISDAIAAFCVGIWKSESDGKDLDKASNDSGYISADSPKQSFSDILDSAIVRELKLEA